MRLHRAGIDGIQLSFYDFKPDLDFLVSACCRYCAMLVCGADVRQPFRYGGGVVAYGPAQPQMLAQRMARIVVAKQPAAAQLGSTSAMKSSRPPGNVGAITL